MQPLDVPYEEFEQFLDERYATIKRNINPKLSPYFKEIIISTFSQLEKLLSEKKNL